MDGIGYLMDVGFHGLGLVRYLVAGIAPAAVVLMTVLLGNRYGRGDGAALTARRLVILLCAGLSPMLFLGAAHAIVAEKDMTLGEVVRIAAVNSQYVEVCDSAADRVSLADVKSASDFLRARDVLWPNADTSRWAPLKAGDPIPCSARPNVELEPGAHLRYAYGSISRVLSILGYASFLVLMVALCAEWGGPRTRNAVGASGHV